MTDETTSTLLDEVKVALRVTHDKTDGEIQMWIDAALADMERVGIDPDFLAEESAQVKAAVVSFVKANYGMDNDEAPRFEKSYRQFVCDLMNSHHNLSAQSGSDEPEDPGETEESPQVEP